MRFAPFPLALRARRVAVSYASPSRPPRRRRPRRTPPTNDELRFLGNASTLQLVLAAAFGVAVLVAFAATAGTEVAFLGAGLEALIGVEALEGVTLWFGEQSAAIQELINGIGDWRVLSLP